MRRRVRMLRERVAELETELEMEQIKRRVMLRIYAKSIETLNKLAAETDTPP